MYHMQAAAWLTIFRFYHFIFLADVTAFNGKRIGVATDSVSDAIVTCFSTVIPTASQRSCRERSMASWPMSRR